MPTTAASRLAATAWKVARLVLVAITVTLLLLIITTVVSSRYLHRLSNTSILQPPYRVSEQTSRLHESLLIADLHIDSAVYLVDFSKPQSYGHVGWDRIRAGGLSLMTLSLPTEVSIGGWRGINGMAIGGIVNGQPVETWSSNYRRGQYFLGHIERVVAANPDRMFMIRTREDAQSLIEERKPGGSRRVGIMVSVEGIHILDGELEKLPALIDSGVRMISLTHAFDNEAAGANTGRRKGGLTAYGREALRLMQQHHVVLDLAHLSETAAGEALDIVDMPVVVSHTGVRGTCDKDRNISDDLVRRVADGGGVIGIGVFRSVLCGDEPSAIVRAMNHVRDLVGIEYIALGSDFDGAVTVIFDAGGLPLLTEALLREGYAPEEIRMIMGGNTLRVLSRVLPTASAVR